MKKIKVTKVFKPGKGKKPRKGGRHMKVRRSDAGGSAMKKALDAFPVGADAFPQGMPATAPGTPDLPLPDPSMAMGMGGGAGAGLGGMPPMKRG